MTSRRLALKALGLPLAAAWMRTSSAQAGPANPAAPYANNIYIGYILSPSAAVNAGVREGMEALAKELANRTTIRAKGSAGLDPEKDDLSFFRFLYWPVTPDAPSLSEKARKRVQHYIDKGGVILFDLRDASGQMRDPRAIRRLLADMNIKPLEPLPKDHTLTKTFYLLTGLPGSSAYGAPQIEIAGPKGTESVSSVIIGDNNWADAWAGKSALAGTREREMALRAGIQMVLYAYGGNVKADPIQEILKRQVQ